MPSTKLLKLFMYQYENIFFPVNRYFSVSNQIQKQKTCCFYESYKRLKTRPKYPSPPFVKEKNRLFPETPGTPGSFSPCWHYPKSAQMVDFLRRRLKQPVTIQKKITARAN